MDASRTPLSEAEFEEIMNRNRAISSSAISRAVSDASAGANMRLFGLYGGNLIVSVFVFVSNSKLHMIKFSSFCLSFKIHTWLFKRLNNLPPSLFLSC